MKKTTVYIMICLIGVAGFFSACSGGDEEAGEKGAIEQMTDDAAKSAADKILAPVESARDVKDMEDKRLGGYQEVMEE